MSPFGFGSPSSGIDGQPDDLPSLTDIKVHLETLDRLYQQEYIEHQVKAGETLVQLGDEYEIYPGTIRVLNRGLRLAEGDEDPLDNYMGNTVRVGIRVGMDMAHSPLGTVTSSVVSPHATGGVDWTLEYKINDFLDKISSHLNIPVEAIREYNPEPPGRIPSGELYWVRLPLPDTEFDPENLFASPHADVLTREHIPRIPTKDLCFQGPPPEYGDDVLPERNPSMLSYTTMIGDVMLEIPPEFITVNRVTEIDNVGGIRMSSPMITSHGNEVAEIQMSFYFAGEEGINGVRTPSPYAQSPYYMDGLRAFMAQLHALPFLPIVNEYLNEVWNIHAIAIASVTTRTLESFPDVIRVDITAYHFNTVPYLMKTDDRYWDFFVWPLFRWYYQRALHKLDPASKKRYFAPYRPSGLDRFEMQILDEDYDEEQEQWTREWIDIELDSVVVTDAVFGFINVLTQTQLQTGQSPTQQYMGSLDDRVYLTLETDNPQDAVELDAAFRLQNEINKNESHRRFRGNFRVNWPLANTMGFNHVMIENFQAETVPNFPGLIRITMILRVFDPRQNEREEVHGIVGAPGTFDVTRTNETPIVLQDIANEQELYKIDLYPDLNLPTYQELQSVMSAIDRFRREHNKQPLNIKNPLLTNERLAHCYVEPDFFMTYDMEGLYQELVDDYRDSRPVEGGVTPSTMVVNPIDAIQERTVPFLEEIPDASEEEVVSGMWHDSFFYESRGRMVRAYPTYLLLFIDEGIVVDGRRLWDIAYVSQTVIDITVSKTKNSPIDSCVIDIHDVHGSLDERFWGDLRQLSTLEKIKNFIQGQPLTERIIQNRIEFMQQRSIHVQPGARVHVRMGYGSLGGQLPIVFNGVIAEMQRDIVTHIVCQSDGYQMVESISNWAHPSDKYIRNTGFGLGGQPSDVIREVIADRSFLFNLGDRWGLESPHGINHFGFVLKDAWADFGRFQPGTQNREEITKNIYSAKIEDLVEADQEIQAAYDRNPQTRHMQPGELEYVREQEMQHQAREGYSARLFHDYLNPPKEGSGPREPKIQIWLHEKSLWDVGSTFAGIVPEYRFAIHDHQFRSTAFFGMGHWPVRYGFALDEGGNILEKYKPFVQMHHIYGLTDLITNGLTASSAEIATVVHSMFNEGRSLRSVTVHADKSIRSDRQRPIQVDTGTVQDVGSFRIPLINLAINLVPDLLLRLFGFRWGEECARWAAKQTLAERMSRMYTGIIGLVGDPAIRPGDLVSFNDDILKMNGTVEAGSVVHKMSLQTGYQTSVRPLMMTGLTNSAWSRVLVNQISVGTGFILQFTRLWFLKIGTAIWQGERLQRGVGFLARIRQAEGARVAAEATRATASAGKSKLLSWLGEKKVGKWAIAGGKAVGGGVQALLGSLGVGAGGAAGTLIAAKLLTLAGSTLIFYFITKHVIDSIESLWGGKNEHVVSLFPVFQDDVPYVIGIDGHENLVPGWSDVRISDERRRQG